MSGFGPAASSVPAGTLVPFGGAVAPAGWLLCDGSAVSRTLHKSLFDVIGTTFGAGDGAATFNVPDLRGRTAAGKDDMGGAAANRLTTGGSGINGAALGASGGTETHTLSTAQLSAHSHDQDGRTVLRDTGETALCGTTLSSTQGGTSGSTGSGGAHQNTQPTIITNYIIKG